MSSRLDVLVVREDEKSGKSYWTRVGVAFPTKDGTGWNLSLDALPTNGKLFLREPKPKAGKEEDAF